MDYDLYEEAYEMGKTMIRKPPLDATTAGKIKHNALPIDFSFMHIQDVISLKKE